jgi:hypothetical protein
MCRYKIMKQKSLNDQLSELIFSFIYSRYIIKEAG